MSICLAWTDVQLAAAARRWHAGASVAAIASRLDVSRSASSANGFQVDLPRRCGAPSIAAAPSAAERPHPVTPPSLPRTVLRRERRVSLVELAPGMCRWPLGDPQDADFTFCGDAADEQLPYCGRHCAVAYRDLAAARRKLRYRHRPEAP